VRIAGGGDDFAYYVVLRMVQHSGKNEGEYKGAHGMGLGHAGIGS
jgi:hypothetical protein